MKIFNEEEGFGDFSDSEWDEVIEHHGHEDNFDKGEKGRVRVINFQD